MGQTCKVPEIANPFTGKDAGHACIRTCGLTVDYQALVRLMQGLDEKRVWNLGSEHVTSVEGDSFFRSHMRASIHYPAACEMTCVNCAGPSQLTLNVVSLFPFLVASHDGKCMTWRHRWESTIEDMVVDYESCKCRPLSTPFLRRKLSTYRQQIRAKSRPPSRPAKGFQPRRTASARAQPPLRAAPRTVPYERTHDRPTDRCRKPPTDRTSTDF